MRRHRLNHAFRFADRGFEHKFDCRMPGTQGVDEPWHVVFQMPSLGDEQRNDQQPTVALVDQGFDAGRKVWGNKLEECKFDPPPGGMLAQSLGDTAHRIGPLGIARTVAEQDEGGCYHEMNFA